MADDLDSADPPPLTPASILATWQNVDLPHIQLALDEQAQTITTQIEQRLETRKELSSATKAFRATHDREPERDELLKRYQTAIDQVSQHAKYGGNAFLVLFRILRQLPDPALGLSQALEEASGAAEERARAAKAQASLQDKVDALVAALEKSRGKLKDSEELRVDRERFQEEVMLNGEVRGRRERTDSSQAQVSAAIVRAEERLAHAEQAHEDEVVRLQGTIESLGAQVERLQEELLRKPTPPAQPMAPAEDPQLAAAALALEVASRASKEAAAAYEEQIAEVRTHGDDCAAAGAAGESAGAGRGGAAGAAVGGGDAGDDGAGRQAPGAGLARKLAGGCGALRPALTPAQLEANQRLSEDLARCRAQLDKEREARQARDERAVQPSLGDGEQAAATLRDQRDRLRAVVERRDVAIEQLRNALEDKDVKLRSLEGDNEALKQRVKFLQSYKVSERSTLLPPSGDVEQALGRGVSHQFRNFFERPDAASDSGGVADRLRQLSRRRGRLCLAGYLVAMHATVLVLVMLHSC